MYIRQKREMKKLLIFLVLTIIWSSNSILNEFAAKNIGVFASNFILRAFTFVSLFVVYIIRKKKNPFLMFAKNWKSILLFSATNLAVDLSSWIGLQYSSSLNANALNKLNIVVTMVINIIFFKQKVHPMQIVSCVGLVVGGVMVCYSEAITFNVFDLLFILSMLVDVISVFLIKHFLKKMDNMEPIDLAMFVNMITGAVFIVPAFATGNILSLGGMDGTQIALFSLMGVINTVLLCLYYYVIKLYDLFEVKMYLIGVTILTAILSVIFFERVLSAINIVGIALVVLSTFGYNLADKRREKLQKRKAEMQALQAEQEAQSHSVEQIEQTE